MGDIECLDAIHVHMLRPPSLSLIFVCWICLPGNFVAQTTHQQVYVHDVLPSMAGSSESVQRRDGKRTVDIAPQVRGGMISLQK